MKKFSSILVAFLGLFLSIACESPASVTTNPKEGEVIYPRGLTGTILDVRTFGAKGNGTTMDTAAIQAAIDAAPAGATVFLGGGTFLSATLRLKSNLVFWIDSTATLRGSRYFNDYPKLTPPTNNKQLSNCQRALLYAEGVTNLVMEGGGTIDGQNGVYDRAGDKEYNRPMAIWSVVSNAVTYRNLKVINSCTWSVVSMEVTGLTIQNLNVQTKGITRDGIDLIDCHSALVENCTVDTGDDGICLKTHSAMGLRDIVIRNCTVKSNTNALKFGTPTYGPINNIVFDNITIGTTRYAGIALECIDGSDESNITFQNIRMSHVGVPFFVLLGNRGSTPAGLPAKIGTMDNIKFFNITADNMDNKWGCIISGTNVNGTIYRPTNLMFQNVNITFDGGSSTVPSTPPEYVGQYPDPNLWGDLPAFGYFVRHVSGMTMVDCSVALSGTDARPWLVLNDAPNFSNTATGSTNPETVFRVHRDVGYGNNITLRGDSAPLTWSKGVAASWTTGNVWIWKTTAFANAKPLQFKALKNDTVWETGGNHTGLAGMTFDIYPAGF